MEILVCRLCQNRDRGRGLRKSTRQQKTQRVFNAVRVLSIGANIQTEEVISAHMKQGRSSEQEILAEDSLTTSLNLARDVCGQSMRKGTAENGLSDNAAASDGKYGADETSELQRGVIRSAAVLGGSMGDQATVDDLASLDMGLDRDIPLLSSLENAVLQRTSLTFDKVNEAGVANGGAMDTLLIDAKGALYSGGIEEITAEREGIKAVEVPGQVNLERDIPESVGGVVDDEIQQSLPKLEPGDKVKVGGLDCKEAEQKQLSKSALKQMAKHERYKEIKMQKKAIEKEKRHQETARKRREWEEKLASLTEDEKEKVRLEKLSIRKERKDEQKSRREKLKQALETGQNLVIDLEFSHLMKPNELTSLIQQVMYSYAANGRAAVPARISLTGVRGDVLKELEKISGFNNWLVHNEERSYVEVFQERRSDLVYLTADSENVLESLDITKIYIIGGLVDRNRWKNITLEKASEQKIATAKLPIGDHLKMLASQVLTVNQVMELLLSFLEMGDWKKSLMQVVPLRKRAAEENLKESWSQQES